MKLQNIKEAFTDFRALIFAFAVGVIIIIILALLFPEWLTIPK